MKLINVICIFSIISAVYSEKRSYEGYSLFKMTPKTEDDLTVLKYLQDKNVGEFWDDQLYKNYEMRIMVPRENRKIFYDIVDNSGIVAEEVIKDVQRAIDEQLEPATRSAQGNHSFLSMNWNQYYSLEEIYDWLDRVQQTYPNVVTIVNMGSSVENRTIKGVRINYKPNQNNTLIGMYQGTLHAREWITTTTVTWIIKEFLTSTDPNIRAFAENFEWHLFPVVNPDGYVYTFTTNRMWRKNRSRQNFTTCVGGTDDLSNGVDLNRNFDFAWMTAGASNNSCSQTFAGPAPNSEPETRAISQYILNLNTQGRFMYFIDFHSYTQIFCIPYSNTVNPSDVLTSGNYANMYELAIRGAEKLGSRYGTNYGAGVAGNVLYPMSGTTFDWAKNATNVPFSYLIELRDMGDYGFLLPAEQIIPNSLEIMDALLEMDKTAIALGYYYSSSHTILSSIGIICVGLLIILIH
ncbi:unnamed protein product [Euphydryas editha]|uniref:Peptidase M14 domain-containing protein n=1 Tax=Euphydryas editha TaxID=104508 RepID=A0AAU9U6M4_EUPED|nr:unnamed protein product [Euphydryas editha]